MNGSSHLVTCPSCSGSGRLESMDVIDETIECYACGGLGSMSVPKLLRWIGTDGSSSCDHADEENVALYAAADIVEAALLDARGEPWFYTVEDRRAGKCYYPLSTLARHMPGGVAWSLSLRQALWFDSWQIAEDWRRRRMPERGRVRPVRCQLGTNTATPPPPPKEQFEAAREFAGVLEAGTAGAVRAVQADLAAARVEISELRARLAAATGEPDLEAPFEEAPGASEA